MFDLEDEGNAEEFSYCIAGIVLEFRALNS